MKKLLFLFIMIILLVLACDSSTDSADEYFEPVEDKYKQIEVPIITESTLTAITGGAS
jgi:outer membrane protein assembly factor BamD (BamD/ComL family)